MRAALADDDSLNYSTTSGALPSGAPEYLQLITIAAPMFGDGIKVGFAGSQ